MLCFEELTDEELSEYINSFQNDTEKKLDMKKKIAEYICGIRKGLQQNAGTLKKIEKTLREEENCDNLFEQLTSVSKSIANKSDRISEILADFGIIPKTTDVRTDILDVELNFRFFEDTIIIELPELLPHRPVYDVCTKTMRYFYDYDKWKNSYEKAFRKQFEHGKFSIYDDKVCVIFLHHFDKKKKRVPDPDNLETKAIIDIIALYLLRDDSHKYMSHYVDAVEDDRSFTEIIVCPISKIHEYI